MTMQYATAAAVVRFRLSGSGFRFVFNDCRSMGDDLLRQPTAKPAGRAEERLHAVRHYLDIPAGFAAIGIRGQGDAPVLKLLLGQGADFGQLEEDVHGVGHGDNHADHALEHAAFQEKLVVGGHLGLPDHAK